MRGMTGKALSDSGNCRAMPLRVFIFTISALVLFALCLLMGNMDAEAAQPPQSSVDSAFQPTPLQLTEISIIRVGAPQKLRQQPPVQENNQPRQPIHKQQLALWQIYFLFLFGGIVVRAFGCNRDSCSFYFQAILRAAAPVRAGPFR
jgi:hypothetical protein